MTVGTTRSTDSSPDNLLVVRYNPNGSLDTTFGTGGTAIVVYASGTGASFGAATDIALQADGKILVSESRGIFRFNADGSPDTAFGTGGVIRTMASGSISLNNFGDIKAAPGGKILVCGAGNNNTFIQGFGLARLNQDGSLDSSFGRGGIVRTAFTTGTAAAGASEIDIAANGKIALGGSVNPQSSPGQLGIAVYNADGSPDSTFGTDGRVLVAGTNVNFFGSLAWQSDGKIVICGRRLADNGGTPAYLRRFTASGAVDTAFGTNGEVIPTVTNRPLITLNDVVIQPDGKILGFGSGFVSFQGTLAAWLTVVRLSPSGALDSSFGTGGIVTTPFNTNFNGNQSQALTGFLQTDGKIVAAGVEFVINPTTGTGNSNIAIARYANTPGVAPVNNPALRIADFDGDGKTDASVFRSGTWFINPSSNPSLAEGFSNSPQAFYGVQFGLPSDKLTPADFDGDGKTDIAVWRENVNDSFGYFYILQSLTGTVRIVQFGQTGDDPRMVGDWDGDGKADPAVYRNGANGGQSYFYYRPSAQPAVDFVTVYWGTGGDEAVRGDYDGDGKLDAAVFRASDQTWYIRQSSNNQPRYDSWGLASDKRVSGDFDGDGKTDLTVFRNGVWYIKQSSNSQPLYRSWGLNTDKLVAGDYDGDGKTDVAVWRNGIYYILQITNSQADYRYFGTSGDLPVASAFVP